MQNAIEKLKTHGYSPNIVFDIGAYHGHWTDMCKTIYPDAHYYLFEAIDYKELDRFRNTTGFAVFNIVLNKENVLVPWFQGKNTGDSMFKELTVHYRDCSPKLVQSFKLTDIISVPTSTCEIFIKIDCQGAEIPILKGAGKLLDSASFVLLEVPFFGTYNDSVPSFLEHITFMEQIGYTVFDIAEIHNIKNLTVQIDIVFIKKTHPLCERVKQLLMEL